MSEDERKLPDLGTCIHGTPTMVPCPTCDARYGSVDASDAVKLRHCHATLIETERQLAEAQAQCAAMREELRSCLVTGKDGLLHHHDCVGQYDYPCKGWCQETRAALTPEAGKELLARLEKAEQERDRWRATSYSLHPFNVRAAALEEAAKVAEKTDAILQLPTGSEWVGKALAAAIRTLATAPKGET